MIFLIVFWLPYYFVDKTYATEDKRYKATEKKSDYQVESDKIFATQRRIWQYEDRYKGDITLAPPAEQKEWEKLINQLNEQETKIKGYGIKSK